MAKKRVKRPTRARKTRKPVAKRGPRRAPARRRRTPAKARPANKPRAKAKSRRAAKARPAARPQRGRARGAKPSRAVKPSRATAKRTRQARPAAAAAKTVRRQSRTKPAAAPARLHRDRRLLSDVERTEPAPGMSDARMLAAARTGQQEMQAKRRLHTESSPELTAGDPDAKWDDAYAQGDETPGGDNPTPDQTQVDEIGRAMGVEYQDNQELQGGDELANRDEHRWEFDPASSEDWPHKKDED